MRCASAWRTLAARVDAALKEDDPDAFLETLAFLDKRWHGIPFEDTPDPLGMFGGLWILYQDVTTEGIWKYLDQSEGSQFHHAVRWCETIGATRAEEYLRRVATHFDDSVPVDAETRFELRSRIERVAHATGTKDPLDHLDRAYADAMPTMVDALRVWLLANRETALRALGEIGAPPARLRDDHFVEKAEAFVDNFESMVADGAKTRAAETGRLRQAAQKAGLLPWRAELRPECDHFLDVARLLTPEQWQIVALRVAENTRAHRDALDQAATFKQLVESSQLVDRSAFMMAFRHWYAKRKPLLGATEKLPDNATLNGKPVDVETDAFRAVILATLALPLHDWLEHVQPNGAHILETAYAPFKELAPTPSVLPISRRRHIIT